MSVSPLETVGLKSRLQKVKVPNGGTMVRVNSEGKSKPAKREPEKPAVENLKLKKPQKAEKKGKLTFTDEQFIEALKQLGKAASSREISDQLGIENPDVGRAYVRNVMERLIKTGKAVAVKPEGKTKVKLLYKLP